MKNIFVDFLTEALAQLVLAIPAAWLLVAAADLVGLHIDWWTAYALCLASAFLSTAFVGVGSIV